MDARVTQQYETTLVAGFEREDTKHADWDQWSREFMERVENHGWRVTEEHTFEARQCDCGATGTNHDWLCDALDEPLLKGTVVLTNDLWAYDARGAIAIGQNIVDMVLSDEMDWCSGPDWWWR